MKKVIKKGEAIPNWHAVAWVDYNTLHTITYPIPLNFVMRYAWKFYWWYVWIFKRIDLNGIKKTRDKYYKKGMKRGKNDIIEVINKIKP